jgi:hypothetical protein
MRQQQELSTYAPRPARIAKDNKRVLCSAIRCPESLATVEGVYLKIADGYNFDKNGIIIFEEDAAIAQRIEGPLSLTRLPLTVKCRRCRRLSIIK